MPLALRSTCSRGELNLSRAAFCCRQACQSCFSHNPGTLHSPAKIAVTSSALFPQRHRVPQLSENRIALESKRCNLPQSRSLTTAKSSASGSQDNNYESGPGLTQNILTWIKRLTKCLLGAASFAALLLALLPSILSTGPGLRAGTTLASKFLPGHIQVQKADLGWTKPIKLRGVAVRTPTNLGGETLAVLPSISTSQRLISIARGQSFDAFAASPWIDCSLAPTGQFKWAQLLDYEAGRAAISSSSKKVLPRSQDGSEVAPHDTTLVKETSELPFTAEGRLLKGSLYISDGTLRIPQEIKEVLGRDLHAVAVIGAQNVRESADEFSLPTEWLSADPGAESAPTASSTGARGKPPSLAAAKCDAAIFAVRSEHLDVELSGWQQPDGRLRLRQPAKAHLQFTPALAKHGLARVSPLLSGVLAVEEGIVKVGLTTSDMHLPSQDYHIRIDPLRVAVSRQDMLAKVIEFLRLKEGKEVAHKSLLQGATSAIHVDIDNRGSVASKRLDLLISGNKKSQGKLPGRLAPGVHLCTWGKVDPVTGSLDLALGIPSDTLSMVGLKGSKEAEMLVLPMKGSAANPRVDWKQAYKRLASLAASYQKEPASLRGQLLQGIVQSLDMRANAPGLASPHDIPKPPEKLPWEEDSQLMQNTVHVDDTTVRRTDDA